MYVAAFYWQGRETTILEFLSLNIIVNITMKPKDVLSYLTAADVLRAQYDRETAIYEAQGLEPGSCIPLDAGLHGAVEIYGSRIMTIGLYTGTVACRLTGLDATYRGIRHLAAGRRDPSST